MSKKKTPAYTNCSPFCILFFVFLQEACQNYIRIMVVTSPGRLFVCGTNSFRPMCNTYIINDNNYTLEATKNGQAVCPYDRSTT